MLSRLKNLLGLATASGESGARGEAAAADFLKRVHGFSVLAVNWRNPRDRREEIDLVVRDGEALVFVEVKTRAAAALVTGYHAVNSRKKTILRRAATAYLRTLAEPPATFRLDVVEVALSADGAVAEVRHYENIALFPKHFQP